MGWSIDIDPDSPLPLAAQISDQIRWLIAGQVLNPGDDLPGAQELADQIGVNFHTVRAGYQQLAAEGVISLSRGRRTRVLSHGWPRVAARVSPMRSYSLGVIVPEFIQTYGRLIVGIEAEAAAHTTMVYVANAHESSELARNYLERFWAKGVDGVVVAAALIEAGTELPEQAPPTVFIDSPGAPGVSIDFDLDRSQYLATRHLIEHGHRRIGFVAPPRHLANVAPKVDGHRRALDEADIALDDSLTAEADGFSVASGHQAGFELLDRDDPPTAITATADALAAGVCRAARRLGIRIPDDLAVTSNDDSELASLMDPPLTTVTLPLEAAGRLAVRRIQELRHGERPTTVTELGVELVIRESCGCSERADGSAEVRP